MNSFSKSFSSFHFSSQKNFHVIWLPLDFISIAMDWFLSDQHCWVDESWLSHPPPHYCTSVECSQPHLGVTLGPGLHSWGPNFKDIVLYLLHLTLIELVAHVVSPLLTIFGDPSPCWPFLSCFFLLRCFFGKTVFFLTKFDFFLLISDYYKDFIDFFHHSNAIPWVSWPRLSRILNNGPISYTSLWRLFIQPHDLCLSAITDFFTCCH